RSHYTAMVIGFLRGEIQLGNAAYQAAMAAGDDFNFNKGALSFMLGDIETGIDMWRKLTPLQKRQLFNVTYAAEKYFPAEVIEDPRYQTLLEELDFGISWQRRLMEGVMAMEETTGVGLNPLSRQAYENHTFLSRNNLWSPEQWSNLETRKLQRMQATTRCPSHSLKIFPNSCNSSVIHSGGIRNVFGRTFPPPDLNILALSAGPLCSWRPRSTSL